MPPLSRLLGPVTMARICDLSYRQIAWAEEWCPAATARARETPIAETVHSTCATARQTMSTSLI
jgi:hypothetical protein